LEVGRESVYILSLGLIRILYSLKIINSYHAYLSKLPYFRAVFLTLVLWIVAPDNSLLWRAFLHSVGRMLMDSIHWMPTASHFQ
jgi:hypothetical protein